MTEQENEQEWAIENDWTAENRRQYERYIADFYLCVYEEESLLGDVIDISLGGLKLLSDEILPIGQIMSLRLDAALESGRQVSLEFEARVVWSDQDENTDRYKAGLEFLGLSASAREILQSIISELSN
ncbi:MAG: PilZ domain-containing protein [Candidatus Competibacteraceae bacterium]|nr:PilZ domain-containing protein [Candidatus Competibacteraceae bacterium]HRY15474.1 PilZ domain-containing protein [Candidatus Competibacteraceae bacterium]